MGIKHTTQKAIANIEKRISGAKQVIDAGMGLGGHNFTLYRDSDGYFLIDSYSAGYEELELSDSEAADLKEAVYEFDWLDARRAEIMCDCMDGN